MKNTPLIVLAVIALALLGWFVFGTNRPATPGTNQQATTTVNSLVTASGLSIHIPDTYGVALTKTQILVQSYIPPCDENFNYCLYRTGTEYKGTNFESAGLRLLKRSDLASQTTCLTTPPVGYTTLTPNKTVTKTSYATSVFSPIGDAGAGHYAAGSVYRLFANNVCTEFETRIGETQYANYPAGTIKLFTDANRASVQAEFLGVLNGITLKATGEKVVFPAL